MLRRFTFTIEFFRFCIYRCSTTDKAPISDKGIRLTCPTKSPLYSNVSIQSYPNFVFHGLISPIYKAAILLASDVEVSRRDISKIAVWYTETKNCGLRLRRSHYTTFPGSHFLLFMPPPECSPTWGGRG